MIRNILSTVILLMGLALAVGGVWLSMLGGTWGYILLGALLMISALLLFAGRKGGLLIYGVAMLFALGWGVFEVGLYWWGFAPRGGSYA